MLKQLRAARSDQTYYTTPDVLILDDLGLMPLSGEEPIDLYEIIRARYQRGSTVITSNRSATEIGRLFPDPLLASAAMDRLLHDAHVLVLEGDSFRNPPPTNRPKSKKQEEQSAL